MADIDENMLDIAREKLPGFALYTSGEQMAREADIVTTGARSLRARWVMSQLRELCEYQF